MAAPFFKDSHELRCNALKLRLQEVITQDHVVQEEEKKKRKKRVIQIIAWLAKKNTGSCRSGSALPGTECKRSCLEAVYLGRVCPVNAVLLLKKQ